MTPTPETLRVGMFDMDGKPRHAMACMVRASETAECNCIFGEKRAAADAWEKCEQARQTAEDDVALLTKALQDAIDGKACWDLAAKAMVQPINRMVDRMRRAGATPAEVKSAFDAAQESK